MMHPPGMPAVNMAVADIAETEEKESNPQQPKLLGRAKVAEKARNEFE